MRDVLVRFARDVELPRFTRRIENVCRLLFIGNCLSASLVDSVRSTVAEETHVAVVASGCSGAPEGVTTVHSNVTVAGTLDRILLPTGWAEGIVGHCVLDELPTPVAAFTERARVIGGTRQLERAAEKGHRHRADGHWPEDAPREVAGPKEQCGADNRNQEVQDEGERVAWSSHAQRVAPLGGQEPPVDQSWPYPGPAGVSRARSMPTKIETTPDAALRRRAQMSRRRMTRPLE